MQLSADRVKQEAAVGDGGCNNRSGVFCVLSLLLLFVKALHLIVPPVAFENKKKDWWLLLCKLYPLGRLKNEYLFRLILTVDLNELDLSEALSLKCRRAVECCF